MGRYLSNGKAALQQAIATDAEEEVDTRYALASGLAAQQNRETLESFDLLADPRRQ